MLINTRSFGNRTIANSIIIIVLCMATGIACYAQAPLQDRKGGTDHPSVARYPGSVLYNYGVNDFGKADLPLAAYTGGRATKTRSVDGKIFNYFYLGPAGKTDADIYQNYRNHLEKAGFKILYSCNPEACIKDQAINYASSWTEKPSTFVTGYDSSSYFARNDRFPPYVLVAESPKGPTNQYVVLTTLPPRDGNEQWRGRARYFLQVVEAKSLEQVDIKINAAALKNDLATKGKVALYGIYFDTGKADLKPESKPQLDEMAKLLQQNPALKVFIVGHTDNQGSLAVNTQLSQKRAEAVVNSLTHDYKVDPKRLSAKGLANFAPVASNSNEAGRAQNRRVELVEQ